MVMLAKDELNVPIVPLLLLSNERPPPATAPMYAPELITRLPVDEIILNFVDFAPPIASPNTKSPILLSLHISQ